MANLISHAEVCDQILKYLVSHHGAPSVTKISNELSIDHHLCYTLTERFEERGFVESRATNTKESGKPDKLIILKPEGKVFAKESSFIEEADDLKKAEKRKWGIQVLDIAHQIITILLAGGTLWLGYHSINQQQRITELENQVQNLEVQLDKLNPIGSDSLSTTQNADTLSN